MRTLERHCSPCDYEGLLVVACRVPKSIEIVPLVDHLVYRALAEEVVVGGVPRLAGDPLDGQGIGWLRRPEANVRHVLIDGGGKQAPIGTECRCGTTPTRTART